MLNYHNEIKDYLPAKANETIIVKNLAETMGFSLHFISKKNNQFLIKINNIIITAINFKDACYQIENLHIN